jgi:hypothetical protein
MARTFDLDRDFIGKRDDSQVAPPSPGATAQKRNRLFSCGSTRIGACTTRMHILLREIGALAQNLVFEKYGVNW